MANGLLGAVVGVAKGIVLSAVVLMTATTFIHTDNTFFKDSKSWPYLRHVSESLKEVTPKELQEAFQHKSDRQSTWQEKLDTLLPEQDQSGDQGGPQTEEPAPWKPVAPSNDQPAAPAWPGSTDQPSSSD